jgi:hypothetical protein
MHRKFKADSSFRMMRQQWPLRNSDVSFSKFRQLSHPPSSEFHPTNKRVHLLSATTPR